jgi:outer membrane protein, multidrug efflux system
MALEGRRKPKLLGRRHAARSHSLFAALSVVLPALARAAPPEPASPQVDDPMLAPPPSAPHTIGSWDETLALIRANSPDYLSAAEAVRRAEAQREIALAAVLPTVTAQGGYTHQFLSPLTASLAALAGPATANPPRLVGVSIVTPPSDVLTAGGTVSWTALNPRGIYALGTADRAIEATELTFQNQRRQIATAAVDATLATLAAARVAELNRTGLRAALERLALTRTRLQFGQGTELDVDRAANDVATSRLAIVSGDESLQQAREALGRALGSAEPLAPPEGADMASFEAAVARTCRPNQVIERRPDVVAARKRVQIAERASTDADLMFAPTVVLSSSVAYSNEPVLAPATTWSASALLSVPIYDGGFRYGAKKDAVAALEQARQALVAVRLDALVASARAQRAVGVYERSRDVAREQRDVAARIDGRTRDGYAKGLGTSLDLVISAQALRQAEIDLAILEFQTEDARADAMLADAECAY